MWYFLKVIKIMKLKQNHRYLFFVILLIGLAVIFNYKTINKNLMFKSDVNVEVTSTKQQQRVLEIVEVAPTSDKLDELPSSLKNENDLFKQDLFDLTNATVAWQAGQLGYFYTGIIASDYDSYDLETLKQLGKQGDMKALDMLGWRFKQEENYEAALLAYNDAAVLGSTAALEEIARLTGKDIFDRDRYLHMLSYLQTSVLRGDQQALTAAGVQLKVLTDNFSSITPLEIKNINQSGLARYSWLENKRKKMGLPKFNNSAPKYAVEFYLKARKLAGVESVLTGREIPIFLTRTN